MAHRVTWELEELQGTKSCVGTLNHNYLRLFKVESIAGHFLSCMGDWLIQVSARLCEPTWQYGCFQK